MDNDRLDAKREREQLDLAGLECALACWKLGQAEPYLCGWQGWQMAYWEPKLQEIQAGQGPQGLR
jgi:hypothetical protein